MLPTDQDNEIQQYSGGAWVNTSLAFIGPQGPAGQIAHVAYASDANGTGFTYTPSDSLAYQATTFTNSETQPDVEAFAGKWHKVQGPEATDKDQYKLGLIRSRFLNLYKKIYNGASISGGDLSIGLAQINYAIFGDSMSGYKGVPLYNLLRQKFGYRGGIYQNQPVMTGNAYSHSNTNETQYWFNGSWSGITGGSGSLTYNLGGGGQSGDKLKIYYIKGPDKGHFKVQFSTTSLGGVYSDAPGFEDIDCYSETVQSAFITIPTPAGNICPKVVGLSGDIVIIMATMENTTISGIMYYPMGVGGLGWDKASLTANSIIAPVFADIQLDLALLEFKEGDGSSIETYVYPWLDAVNAAYTKTDWCLIGSTPQQNQNDINVSANSALKVYADTRLKYYFDGYSPLVDYNTLVALGWQGDGLHVAAATGFYLSSILFSLIGLDNTFFRPIPYDIRNSKTATSHVAFLSPDSLEISSIKQLDGFDMTLKAKRAFRFGSDDMASMAAIDKYGDAWFNSSVLTKKYKLDGLNAAPSSATDNGTLGEIRWTSTHVYLCIATNTWIRAALTTW